MYICLVALHSIEIAEAYLAAEVPVNENITASPLHTTVAWTSLAAAAALIAYVRVVEIYDRAGNSGTSGTGVNGRRLWLNVSVAVLLYLSVLCKIFLFIMRIYKIILLMDVMDLDDLRPFLIGCSTVVLIALVFLDSYTIYFEVSWRSKRALHFRWWFSFSAPFLFHRLPAFQIDLKIRRIILCVRWIVYWILDSPLDLALALTLP